MFDRCWYFQHILENYFCTYILDMNSFIYTPDKQNQWIPRGGFRTCERGGHSGESSKVNDIHHLVFKFLRSKGGHRHPLPCLDSPVDPWHLETKLLNNYHLREPCKSRSTKKGLCVLQRWGQLFCLAHTKKLCTHSCDFNFRACQIAFLF